MTERQRTSLRVAGFGLIVAFPLLLGLASMVDELTGAARSLIGG